MKIRNWVILALVLVIGVGAFYLSFPKDVYNTHQEEETVANGPQVIGYVGCSNTWQTVEGYHAAGGDKFWEVNKNYGGGTLTIWSETIDGGGRYWTAFNQLLARHPNTDAIWWELCIRHEEAEVTYSVAKKLLEAIHARAPEATIYVSSLPEYPDAVCGITQTVGIERGDELVVELLEQNPELVAGPVLGPMTADETTSDNCHINLEARVTLGQELIDFFGN